MNKLLVATVLTLAVVNAQAAVYTYVKLTDEHGVKTNYTTTVHKLRDCKERVDSFANAFIESGTKNSKMYGACIDTHTATFLYEVEKVK